MKGVFCLLIAIAVVAIDFDAFDEDKIAMESPIANEFPIATESPITSESSSAKATTTTTTTTISTTPEIPITTTTTTTTTTETTTSTTGRTTTTIGTFALTTNEQNIGWNEEHFWKKFDVILTRKFKEWQEEQARLAENTKQATTTPETTTTTTGTMTDTTTESANDGDWFEDFPGLPQFPEEKEIILVGREEKSAISTFFRCTF